MANGLPAETLPEQALPVAAPEQDLTQVAAPEQDLPQVAAPTTTIAQALGSMNDLQIMEFKHLLNVNRKKQQITSNVGAKRSEYYFEKVENKSMSLDEALRQSKEALTPTMLGLNKKRFQKNMTSSEYNKLWERTGKLNWSTTEYDLWYKNLTALASAERSVAVEKGQLSNKEAVNKNSEEKARVYFNSLEHYIKNALSGGYDPATGKRIPRKESTIVDKAWSALMAEFQKDMGYDENDNFSQELYNTGDQKEMFDQLWLLVHNIPEDQLKRARYTSWADDPEPIPEEFTSMSPADQREVIFEKLKQLIIKAKLQLANIKELKEVDQYEGEPEAVDPYDMYRVK